MPSPPGTRLPAIAQVGLYARDPLGFLIRFQRRYGDVFTVSFPFFRRIVYLADPTLVRELFTTPPEQAHAGEARASSRPAWRSISSYTKRSPCGGPSWSAARRPARTSSRC